MENYMSLKDFKDRGYLQEANRIFFHPLGLQLEVNTNNIDGIEEIQILDRSIVPEGLVMSEEEITSEKAKEIAKYFFFEINKRMELRIKTFKFAIQPIFFDTTGSSQ